MPKRSFKGTPGYCIVPADTEDKFEPLHYFGLYDEDGNKLAEKPFGSLNIAQERAKANFPDREYFVSDLTEEWYVLMAQEYRVRIKGLKPSFKLSSIVLDMSRLCYSRSPDNWYTVIPFQYNGVCWVYHESASTEWCVQDKLKLCKK